MPISRIGEAPKPEPVKQETKPENKPESKPVALKVKQVGGRRWWMVGIAAVLILAGFGGFAFYASNIDLIAVGVISIVAVLGGAILAWSGLQKENTGIIMTAGGKKKNYVLDANSVNIYPGHIEFEKLPEDQLQGQPRRCRNDNKYYYVHIWGSAWGNKLDQLIQWILPDTQYRDPRELANNLNIPAHRRLASRKSSLLEKISPWVLVAAIIISGIIWIATTPAPGTGG